MRVNYLAIKCIDINAIKTFFMKYFDVREGREYRNSKTGLHSWILLFTEGSTKLELTSWADINSTEASFNHSQGLVYLSISSNSKENVDKITSHLKADGYTILSNPKISGDGYYKSRILGPENIEIEITI